MFNSLMIKVQNLQQVIRESFNVVGDIVIVSNGALHNILFTDTIQLWKMGKLVLKKHHLP